MFLILMLMFLSLKGKAKVLINYRITTHIIIHSINFRYTTSIIKRLVAFTLKDIKRLQCINI